MIKAKIIDCGADYFYMFSTADQIEDVLRKHCKPEGCNPNNHTCITESSVSFIYRGDTSK